jgi:hypothetical protein
MDNSPSLEHCRQLAQDVSHSHAAAGAFSEKANIL